MQPSKWRMAIILFVIAGVSLLGLLYIVNFYQTPSKAFGDAPPPVTSAGSIQMILAFLTSLISGSGGMLISVINWYKANHPTPGVPTDPLDPNTALTSPALTDLLQAFPEWIADQKNTAKSRRFWFDLCQLGIEMDPDPDTKAWLQQGTEILRKKFFPPTPAAVTGSKFH